MCTSRTPRFDPNLHRSPAILRVPTRFEVDKELRRDSFLDDIISRSPVKIKPAGPLSTSKEKEQPVQAMHASNSKAGRELSTEATTMSNSQKRRSRIEDSFDALDAMEDMLDEVRDSLACVDRPQTAGSSSPELGRHTRLRRMQELTSQSTSQSTPQTPSGRIVETSSGTRFQERTSMRIPNDVPQRAASIRPLSKPTAVSNSSKPVNTDKDCTKAAGQNTDPISTLSRHRPRPPVSSISRKPFVPVKSAKPPTVPTFALPGEAISARIKAQREARQASNISASAPGKPSAAAKNSSTNTIHSDGRRNVTGIEVKMTAAALARMQLARGEKIVDATRLRHLTRLAPTATESRPATSRAMAPTASTAARKVSTTTSVPLNKIVTKPTATMMPTQTTIRPVANTPVKRTRPTSGVYTAGVESSLKRTPSTRSLSGQPVSKKPTTMTTNVSLNDRAQAAKRARAEAADRGRQASREWAERMKKRNSGVITGKTAKIPAEQD